MISTARSVCSIRGAHVRHVGPTQEPHNPPTTKQRSHPPYALQIKNYYTQILIDLWYARGSRYARNSRTRRPQMQRHKASRRRLQTWKATGLGLHLPPSSCDQLCELHHPQHRACGIQNERRIPRTRAFCAFSSRSQWRLLEASTRARYRCNSFENWDDMSLSSAARKGRQHSCIRDS